MKLVATFPLTAVLVLIVSQWAQSPAPQANDLALREAGRKVFAGRCAKCHDEDARKKLSDGTTLLTRLAASKDPKALLATRLKSMSEQDGRGVAAYMDDLIARFRSEKSGSANQR